MSARPPVWQMVREAVEALGACTTRTAIRDYIKSKYPDTNDGTISCQITVCTVNQPSRIHYPENEKPRACESRYDFLFATGRGQVVRYEPAIHGEWEIRRDEGGKLSVAQVVEEPTEDDEEGGLPFALESHLRDFLQRNIATQRIGNHGTLRVYRDDNGRDGIEYPTDVGPIDILALDESGNFVVFELKVSHGPDRTVGQVARYMGWIKKHLAEGKKVSGVIVACAIDDKLKYAASVVPDVTLFEYELTFDLRPVALD